MRQMLQLVKDAWERIGTFLDEVGKEPEYPTMFIDGYKWDVIEDDGKRLTLRRDGKAPFICFGRVLFTYRCDWVSHAKRAGSNIVPIR